VSSLTSAVVWHFPRLHVIYVPLCWKFGLIHKHIEIERIIRKLLGGQRSVTNISFEICAAVTVVAELLGVSPSSHESKRPLVVHGQIFWGTAHNGSSNFGVCFSVAGGIIEKFAILVLVDNRPGHFEAVHCDGCHNAIDLLNYARIASHHATGVSWTPADPPFRLRCNGEIYCARLIVHFVGNKEPVIQLFLEL
jgi:hypothetical protein